MTTHDDPAAPVARDPRREALPVDADAAFLGDWYGFAWSVLEELPSGFWNAASFRGAILRLGELVEVADQRASALAFLRRGRALLER
jgi:hypothetical protein